MNNTDWFSYVWDVVVVFFGPTDPWEVGPIDLVPFVRPSVRPSVRSSVTSFPRKPIIGFL